MQRRLRIGRGASRIISADPETGKTVLLFDDPKAALLSAASVGVETEGMLIIGSAIDEGLVVCKSAVEAP
jgi:hypothetical protein